MYIVAHGFKLKSKVLDLVSNHQTWWQIHILVNYCNQNPHFPVREAIKKSNCFLFSDRKRVFSRGANELILLSNNIYNTISDCVLSLRVNSKVPMFEIILCTRKLGQDFGMCPANVSGYFGNYVKIPKSWTVRRGRILLVVVGPQGALVPTTPTCDPDAQTATRQLPKATRANMHWRWW